MNVYESFSQLKDQYQHYLFGHEDLIEHLFIAYLSRGHVLIEGPPGTGKTQTAKLLSKLLSKNFKRVQFTSDLLPSDILGSHLYDPGKNHFEFIKGPIFSDFLLADEINRTPPRTQSALLEAMEERQVTLDGKSYKLSEDFFVLATQNPQDFEGTFLLPEVQLDRFLMKIVIQHANSSVEVKIIEQALDSLKESAKDQISSLSIHRQSLDEEISKVHCEKSLLEYVTTLLKKTREHPLLSSGSSVRGGIALLKCARIKALISQREYITLDDIHFLIIPILRHRIKLSADAQMSNLNEVQVLEALQKEIAFPA